MGIKNLSVIWQIFQIIIGYNLIFPIFIFLVYLIIPRFKNKNKNNKIEIADYAIIITAYEQLNTIVPVVSSLLLMRYKKFLIYLIFSK